MQYPVAESPMAHPNLWKQRTEKRYYPADMGFLLWGRERFSHRSKKRRKKHFKILFLQFPNREEKNCLCLFPQYTIRAEKYLNSTPNLFPQRDISFGATFLLQKCPPSHSSTGRGTPSQQDTSIFSLVCPPEAV